MRQDSTSKLGAHFQIEHSHTGHVTALARKLFDGFSPKAGLPKGDRTLLSAAAFLHDIGYASDPENHVEAAVQILLGNPLPDFSRKDWQSIAATVLLHRRLWRPMLQHTVFNGLGVKRVERIKKMAAMLRIADGLDHGHIQDVSIVFCRRGKNADKIGVECRWYAGNIPWAEEKADLWEAVFKRTFIIQPRYCAPKSPFHGIVTRKSSALSAARRILYSQYDVMRDQIPGMLEAHDPDALHDYRVAMRRFRAALRIFRPLLDTTQANILETDLAGWSDQLSPIRDAHVLLQRFNALDISDRRSVLIRQCLEADAAEANQKLHTIIRSADCQETVHRMNRFLRVELPSLERTKTDTEFKAYAEKRLSGLMARIRAADISRIREDTGLMHALRKRCRRARYYAEFAAPAWGKETRLLAKNLKHIAGGLGDVRDAQLLSERLSADKDVPTYPERITPLYADGWALFTKGWGRITSPSSYRT